MREFRDWNNKGKYIVKGKEDIMPLSYTDLSDLIKYGELKFVLSRGKLKYSFLFLPFLLLLNCKAS